MKNKTEIINDLNFIKKTMEESGTYTNIPALGYLAAGVFGLIGCVATYFHLGSAKLENMNITSQDVVFLGATWFIVFIFSVVAVVLFSALDAKRRRISAWNSLAARLFLSQIPAIVAAGILTVSLTYKGMYELIPAIWLLGYSIVVYSFFYFTGTEHKIQGILFVVLGACASFMKGDIGLLLLAIGFGGIHIVFGIARLLKKVGKHESEEA